MPSSAAFCEHGRVWTICDACHAARWQFGREVVEALGSAEIEPPFTELKIPEPDMGTLSGVKVRSWGERFIADWLYHRNIRFQYEPWLEVRDSNGALFWKRPDFFLPDYGVYWEHFGMWDDPYYQLENRAKLGLYRRAGLPLVCTFGEFLTDDYIRWKLKPVVPNI